MSGPSDSFDLIIIGGGPAGLAAAVESARHGVRSLILDNHPEPGGSVFRDLVAAARHRPGDLACFSAYAEAGLELLAAVKRAGTTILSGSSVWSVEPDGSVHASTPAGPRTMHASRLLIAAGAQERPCPIPGWTRPGVMTAGAAQLLMKQSGLVPTGRVVLAGSGPLLTMVAAQLAGFGADVAAVLDTSTIGDALAGLPRLPAAVSGGPDLLSYGLRLVHRLRRAHIPIHRGVKNLRILGKGDDGPAETIFWDGPGGRGSIAADLVLLHAGLIPDTRITRLLGCAQEWSAEQWSWRPRLDGWGNSSIETVAVAGDGTGIAGWRAAIAAGRMAALDTACRLHRLSVAERDRLARPLQRTRRRAMGLRRFLDRIAPPGAGFLAPPDETILCRCEGVTAGTVRNLLRDGCAGVNQIKAFTRCGMGSCQGRFCSASLANLVVAETGRTMEDVGEMTVRPPLEPMSLEVLANSEE